MLSIILLAHAYLGMRLFPALGLYGMGLSLGWLTLVLSSLLLPLGLAARLISQPPWADRLAWLGLLVMGLFSSLFVLCLLRDVSLLPLSYLLSDAAYQSWQIQSALGVFAGAVLFTFLGLINARRSAAIVDVAVSVANLPAELVGFTIAQISDIHVGPTIKRPYLDAIVDKVNGLEADLVAVTGDLVDGNVADLSAHTAPLARLKSTHGTFFVTGNHEYYSGALPWIAELRRLGLQVLLNEHVLLLHGGHQLVVAGVTDYSAGHFYPDHQSNASAALAGSPGDSPFKLLLAHQPRSAFKAQDLGLHLQLSGHTHGGQFFPWNFFVRFQQPFTAGLNLLGNVLVYTSRGTGYWGPPKRLFAPSEITRVTLQRG
ncbi:metallophosphoesterase [Iodobacter ciconiae]|uniref:Metallophosphoesterase n=2 Tax=Iodobacter ciconiae TaxID=2496266 RepID=A0A3S8ZXD5_9NEIS|nr:metallophosphoesterase [Iodobacter ciconiae]